MPAPLSLLQKLVKCSHTALSQKYSEGKGLGALSIRGTNCFKGTMRSPEVKGRVEREKSVGAANRSHKSSQGIGKDVEYPFLSGAGQRVNFH